MLIGAPPFFSSQVSESYGVVLERLLWIDELTRSMIIATVSAAVATPPIHRMSM